MARYVDFALFAVAFNAMMALLVLINPFPAVSDLINNTPGTINYLITQELGCVQGSAGVSVNCTITLFTTGGAILGVATILTGSLGTMIVFGNTLWGLLITIVLSACMLEFYSLTYAAQVAFGVPGLYAAGISGLLFVVLLFSYAAVIVKVTAKVDITN